MQLLVDSGVLVVGGRRFDWLERIDAMVDGVSRVVGEVDPGTVLIEQPEHFGGGGRAGAARNSGSVLKLMALVFSIRQMVLEVSAAASVVLIPVRTWKGQVPKVVTMNRVRRSWGWEGTDDNEADAVGIGDWWIRKGGLKKYGG
jgi:hypothetical protein